VKGKGREGPTAERLIIRKTTKSHETALTAKVSHRSCIRDVLPPAGGRWGDNEDGENGPAKSPRAAMALQARYRHQMPRNSLCDIVVKLCRMLKQTMRAINLCTGSERAASGESSYDACLVDWHATQAKAARRASRHG
jgi:hypothetical protein